MALPAAIALSGLQQDYFADGLDDVFDQGAVLLRSPSLPSVASQEKRISSISNDTSTVVKNLSHYFDMLMKTQEIELTAEPQLEIRYNNRNILDLAANIEWKWSFTVAKLAAGASSFFENRSQYSRVLGAQIPRHVLITCSIEDCSFKEPRYE